LGLPSEPIFPLQTQATQLLPQPLSFQL
jgi:hypothetical protein